MIANMIYAQIFDLNDRPMGATLAVAGDADRGDRSALGRLAAAVLGSGWPTGPVAVCGGAASPCPWPWPRSLVIRLVLRAGPGHAGSWGRA